MKLNILLRRYSFVMLYAAAVASLTQIVAELPVLLQMEYAFYDPIQKWFTIDNKGDYLYSRYSQPLNDLYCINLDDSFFVDETNRLDRKKLSALLDKFHGHSFKSIFLDFSFEPLLYNKYKSYNVDSLLEESIKPLKDRLIIPYSIELKAGGVSKGFSISDIQSRSTQVYKPAYNGFTAPLYLEGDNLRRYHQFRLDGGIEVSSINALIESEFGGEKSQELFKHLPDKFEINFVLRNEKKFAKLDALNITEAHQVLNKSFEELKNSLNSRVVFIGRFHLKMDHFDNPIDGFDTPVKSKMNGIYFLINTYLNVLQDSYLKKANFWLVFTINFILVSFVVSHFENQKDQMIQSFFYDVRDVLIFTIVFVLLLAGLYLVASIKFPFVVSSIIFLKLKAIKNKFELLLDRIWMIRLTLSNQIE